MTDSLNIAARGMEDDDDGPFQESEDGLLSSDSDDSGGEEDQSEKKVYRRAMWQATFNETLKRQWCERNPTEVRSNCLA